MLDPVRLVSAFLEGVEESTPGRSNLPNLTQTQINRLPTIMGPASDPDSDSTARMDRSGYVYLWEHGEDGVGFWVQAGYVRNGRQRFGQVIDPNDIKWFELAAYKKKLLRAKRSINSVRLPDGDDIWNSAREVESQEALVQRWTEEGDSDGGSGGGSDGESYGVPQGNDIDIM